MIGLILAVVLSVVNNGTDWRIQFAQHSQNVGVMVTTKCYNGTKLVYQSVNYVDIDSAWSEVVTHRSVDGIPRHASCNAEFDVQRNNEGGAGKPENDYTAESARITWTED